MTRRHSTRMALAAAVLLAACADPSGAQRDGTFYGAAVALGNGTARSYVTLRNGAPAELGVALSEDALAGLPGNGAHGHGPEYLLPLPEEAAKTPYRLVALNWNPTGHVPEKVYTLPHFDFHFYTTTEAERNAIDPADPQFGAKAARHPAQEQLPKGYVPIPGAVPRMGVHWVDPTSPELNGKPFTTTFIYGSWDGKLTFAEPMITRAFLESRPSFQAPLSTPEKYAAPGHYPTAYRVYWDAGTKEHRVALSGLTPRS